MVTTRAIPTAEAAAPMKPQPRRSASTEKCTFTGSGIIFSLRSSTSSPSWQAQARKLAREALKSGKSWSDIATENGIDPQILIDAHVALISEQLTAKVSDGLIDQDTADGILAIVKAKAADFINGEHRAKGEALKGWQPWRPSQVQRQRRLPIQEIQRLQKAGALRTGLLPATSLETSSETKNVVAA